MESSHPDPANVLWRDLQRTAERIEKAKEAIERPARDLEKLLASNVEPLLASNDMADAEAIRRGIEAVERSATAHRKMSEKLQETVDTLRGIWPG